MDTLERVPETGTPVLENVTFDEIRIGQSASLTKVLTKRDIEMFAAVSGDVNPALLDEEYARDGRFRKVIGHGMWSGSLVSAVLGTKLPGPGTIYLGQDLRFRRPVGLGDAVTATVTVREKRADKNIVVFDCVCTNQDGTEVVTGTAEVIAPGAKVRRGMVALPEVQMLHHDGHEALLAKAAGLPPVPTAVAHPCDESSLRGAVEAAEAGLIWPILVGPADRIRSVAAQHRLDITPYVVLDVAHSHAAAAEAVALASRGEAKALMKGSLHTDELMGAVVRKDGGLRTGSRISHVFLMNIETYPKPLLITDGAINIEPTLEDKVHIVQNAINLARALGVETPKVAILAAVETVNPRMASTLEAAALCKMADRGQIRGGLLDGPLAFDNAISQVAARTKGITSPVAGDPDILLVPNIEAGNMLAKQFTFLANADAAGIVLGAKVPIILTSRADNVRTRLASCAVAKIMAAAGRGA